MGQLGDYLHELDLHVREMMAALEELDLTEDTILIFSSDNDGQRDDHHSTGKNLDLSNDSYAVAEKSKTVKTVARERFGHRSNGDLPAYKGSNFEGGIRVILIAWPGETAPGTESKLVITLAGMLTTSVGLLEYKLP